MEQADSGSACQQGSIEDSNSLHCVSLLAYLLKMLVTELSLMHKLGKCSAAELSILQAPVAAFEDKQS